MSTINSFHVLPLLTAFAIVYACWTMYYFMRGNGRKGKKKPQGKPSAPESPSSNPDIVGKSRFVLKECISRPQAVMPAESEQDANNNDTFVPSNDVPDYPLQVPQDELDEIFGRPPDGEDNEPLDIEASIETLPDDSFPDEAVDDYPDDEDEDTPPVVGVRRADDNSFENLVEAYRRVVHNPPLTEAQQEETGKHLLQMQGTDIYNALVSDNPERLDKVAHLMDTYLSAFYQQNPEDMTESPSPSGEVPQGFDLKKYVK